MENSTSENTTASNVLSTSNVKKTFTKRLGTTDVGRDYENDLMANIVLQKIIENSSEDFFVWSNDKDFGDFDDVILLSNTKCAIQLKHASGKKTLSLNSLLSGQGNFSIKKYFDSFKKYEQTLSGYNLIIFTNQKFDPDKDKTLRWSPENDLEIQIQIVEVDVNKIINTREENQKCFKFKIAQQNLSSNLNKYEKFFEKFFIYANQLNVTELENNIDKKIKEEYSCKSDVSKNYLYFFTKWNLVDGSKIKIDKFMVKRLLALYLVSANIRPMSFGPISDNRRLFQSAMSKFDVTILNKECSQNAWVECKEDIDVRKVNITNKNYQITKQCVKDLNNEEWTKLLWLMDKCPLIVKESPEVHEAIKLCSDRKFVLVTDKKSVAFFSKLSDLEVHTEIFNDILSNFKFSFHGREINLKQIENKEIQDDITTNELLLMVDKPYQIQEESEELPKPYISRSLTRNIIDFKFLDDHDDDTVVFVSNVKKEEDLKTTNIVDVNTYLNNKSSSPLTLQGTLDDDLNNLRQSKTIDTKFESTNREVHNLRNLNQHHNDKSGKQQVVFTSEDQNSELLFQRICDNKSFKSYHYLRMFDGKLEWIKSVGSISSLKKHRLESGSIKEEELAATNVANNIHIIVGDPGLGKSCFLKNLKNRLSTTIAAIFTPQDMKKMADRKNEEELNSFIMELKYSKWKKLDQCFVKQLIDQNKVIYMWDALDEIVDREDRDKIINYIKNFSEKGIVQWLTCRKHLKDNLEKKFGVLSRTVVEFNETQQNEYIQERLKSVGPSERDELTNKILKNVSILKHRDILSIPLQIYMLTEICLQNKSRDLVKSDFSLADLYEYFVDEKFTFCYNKDESGNAFFGKQEKNMYIRQFEKLALKTILEDDFFNKLHVDMYGILEDWKGFGDKFGFVIEVKKNDSTSTIEFSHISYAEYFVASYLAPRKQKITKNFIFQEKYDNVRFFLDLILAKNCPVHTAVLNENLDELKKSKINTEIKDAWGRNPLHLACSWGGKWRHLQFKKNGDDFECEDYDSDNKETPLKYVQLIEVLISKFDIHETDTFMSMSASEFAKISNSMFALAKIKEKFQTKHLDLDESLKCNILFYSVKFNLKQFIPFFNSYIKHIKLGSEKNTLLHLVCKNGNHEMIQVLTDNGSDINASNGLDYVPFMIACRHGHEKIVQMLIKAKADINASTEDGVTAFMLACQNGHEKIVQMLIKAEVDINDSKKDGWTAFMYACQNGHEKIVQMLIKAQVDINDSENDGWTAFMYACKNEHEKIVQMLIEAKADINAHTENDLTALILACANGNEKIVQMLIEAKADINASAEDGVTAFIVACAKGHEKIVQMLIKAEVDINDSQKDGWTAFMSACQNGHENIMQMLIEAKANINASTEDGVTAFMLACQNGHEKIVQMLIKAQVDINDSENHGRTAFMYACQNGHEKIVQMLIEAKADINASTENGETAFILACANGNEKIVQMLIEAKADINASTENGMTSFILARAEGHEKIVQLLEEANADINASTEDGTTAGVVIKTSKKK